MSHPQGKMWLWWNFSMLFLYFRLVRLLHHLLMRLGCLYCRFHSKLSKNIWRSIKNKSAGNEATCRLFRGFFFPILPCPDGSALSFEASSEVLHWYTLKAAMVVIVIIQMNLGFEIMEANVATSFSCVVQYLFWANKNAFPEMHAHHRN